ncbi:hypothetical protein JW824_03005 [bacterium]|nr:hypothetical protein [bacterium]
MKFQIGFMIMKQTAKQADEDISDQQKSGDGKNQFFRRLRHVDKVMIWIEMSSHILT